MTDNISHSTTTTMSAETDTVASSSSTSQTQLSRRLSLSQASSSPTKDYINGPSRSISTPSPLTSQAPPTPSKSSSPTPNSADVVSPTSPTPRWRDSVATLERRDTISSVPSEVVNVVEPSFDETVLRALCDLDVCQSSSISSYLSLAVKVWGATTFGSNKAEYGVLQSECLFI